MADELHKGADGRLFWYARTNRSAMTEAERNLWAALRGRNLSGFKFRRQHPLKDFIADFYCHECKLVVELDGGYHLDLSQAEYDEGRTFELKELDIVIVIVRFSNEEVINDLPAVLNTLRSLLFKRSDAFPSP